MYVFDASSIIHAWDNYPINNLPPLWDWLANQIDSDQFVISQVAMEEVKDKSEECCEWLKAQGIRTLPLTGEILNVALQIKYLLGIPEDDYHPKGVGENDILIIATAKVANVTLVSDEGLQFRLPDKLSKCRIPAVCRMKAIDVECISFIELIRDSGAVFR